MLHQDESFCTIFIKILLAFLSAHCIQDSEQSALPDYHHLIPDYHHLIPVTSWGGIYYCLLL